MVGEYLVVGVLAVIAGVLLLAGLIQAFQTPVRRRPRQGGIRARTRIPSRRGEADAPAAARRLEPRSRPGLRSSAPMASAPPAPAAREPPPAPAGSADEGLRASLEPGREGLWTGYDHMANVLVQRREFEGARRLIHEVLADTGLPADRREAFKELLSRTYAREIEQLTADAVRTLKDEGEREAVILLERAEGFLSSIPDDALPAKHRGEVSHCVARGYTELGLHRMETGELENALPPLIQALKIGPLEPGGRQETRAVLARALQAVVEMRSEHISQLLKDGKREVALLESARLLALISEGVGVGLSYEELTLPLAKARHVVEEIQQG